MINAGTVLNVVDNTGILKARCIKVYGNTKKKFLNNVIYFNGTLSLFGPWDRMVSAFNVNTNSNSKQAVKVYAFVFGKGDSKYIREEFHYHQRKAKILEDLDAIRLQRVFIHGCTYIELIDKNGKVLQGQIHSVTKQKFTKVIDSNGCECVVENQKIYEFTHNGEKVYVYGGPPAIIDSELTVKVVRPMVAGRLESLESKKIQEAKEGTTRSSLKAFYTFHQLNTDVGKAKFAAESSINKDAQIITKKNDNDE